jgi:hypothetical protein
VLQPSGNQGCGSGLLHGHPERKRTRNEDIDSGVNRPVSLIDRNAPG